MIDWIRFGLTAVFVLAGLVVLCIGVFGVFRFRYAANRMHAAALNDTLGAGLCLIGFAISAPDAFTALKLLLVVAFLWLSSPVASHLLCRLEVETNERRGDYMTVQDGIFDADGAFAFPEETEETEAAEAAKAPRTPEQPQAAPVPEKKPAPAEKSAPVGKPVPKANAPREMGAKSKKRKKRAKASKGEARRTEQRGNEP